MNQIKDILYKYTAEELEEEIRNHKEEPIKIKDFYAPYEARKKQLEKKLKIYADLKKAKIEPKDEKVDHRTLSRMQDRENPIFKAKTQFALYKGFKNIAEAMGFMGKRNFEKEFKEYSL